MSYGGGAGVLYPPEPSGGGLLGGLIPLPTPGDLKKLRDKLLDDKGNVKLPGWWDPVGEKERQKEETRKGEGFGQKKRGGGAAVGFSNENPYEVI
jgi:hypothetical protein